MRSIARDTQPSLAAIVGAIVMAGCSAPSAGAEPQSSVLAVDQVAGFYALSGPGGARCDVSLANLVIDGLRPVLVERCAISAVQGAKAWRATTQGFELMSAQGVVVLAFRRTGVDDFRSLDGGYQLTRAPVP